MNTNQPSDQARKLKDSIVAEIFVAYRQAAMCYGKTTDAKSREMLLGMQHGFERILKHLGPLNESLENIWDELREAFAN